MEDFPNKKKLMWGTEKKNKNMGLNILRWVPSSLWNASDFF